MLSRIGPKQPRKLGQCLAVVATCSTLLVGCTNGRQPENQQPQVSILGVVTGEQEEKLRQALQPFEEQTGIQVKYEGTDAFATLLPARVDSGDAPDIAMFPQPGLMRNFAKNDKLVPLNQFMDQQKLTQAYPEQWLNLGEVNGQTYGLWYRASVKSLVWYNPEEFQAAGYEIPQTWNEMIQLSERMVQDGNTPWCMGMESGKSTGWVGTDWIEDIMLRTAGPEIYDQWVNHEIPFTHNAVQNAFERYGNIVRNDDYVVGGSTGVLTTPFGDSPKGLLSDPPECYMHRQANFIASFFSDDVKLGEDLQVFPLPPIDQQYGTPILAAGDAFAMFNDTPEARKLMQYLATAQPHEIWAGLGGYISPHKQVPLDAYPNELTKKEARILQNADVFRFDASDMMPSEVGTGTFWSGVVDYINGKDVETVLQNIESSWPESQ